MATSSNNRQVPTVPGFPYRAPAGTLPTELPPSMDEILTSDEFYNRRLDDNWTVRVGKHYVVKYGKSSAHIQEGQNMLFVKQATNIPVPTVYEMYKDKDTGYYVLVMEHIEGKTLKDCWRELVAGGKTQEQAEFAGQIRGYIHELRSIPSPGYYGGIWKQGVRDPILTSHGDNRKQPVHPSVKKPSKTEADWCEMMVKAGEASNPGQPFLHSEWVRHKFRTMFSKGHEPKFTHCDIVNRSDIVVRDGKLVPVDWAHAGWYPSYWEYCHAVEFSWYTDDWNAWIAEIFEGMEYVAELGWMMFFRRRIGDLKLCFAE